MVPRILGLDILPKRGYTLNTPLPWLRELLKLVPRLLTTSYVTAQEVIPFLRLLLMSVTENVVQKNINKPKNCLLFMAQFYKFIP